MGTVCQRYSGHLKFRAEPKRLGEYGWIREFQVGLEQLDSSESVSYESNSFHNIVSSNVRRRRTVLWIAIEIISGSLRV